VFAARALKQKYAMYVAQHAFYRRVVQQEVIEDVAIAAADDIAQRRRERRSFKASPRVRRRVSLGFPRKSHAE